MAVTPTEARCRRCKADLHLFELLDYRSGTCPRCGWTITPDHASQLLEDAARADIAQRHIVGALRNLPPFLRMVWRTSPALTLATGVLRIARALLPVVTLYVGKLIIDEVVRLVTSHGAAGAGWHLLLEGPLAHLAGLVALEFALAIGSDLLGRAVSLIDSLLSEKFSNETSLRLMAHAATLDLEDFEDADLQDSLERARRPGRGRGRFHRRQGGHGVVVGIGHPQEHMPGGT